ncbi:dienelactone hydrolase family protein [Nannocystis radixulma]|uniref:Dienelactone hydrolase domain-containing protein n=1 Tax=Nannocystis radixulma TaxID=2995305 RepID=A0ABT5BEC4_9BACT|nr:hypothetical protein [Nannocystis radixulma]MDC0672500.1 hypothetical protein [Nannocystis radixulma]
MFDGAWERSQPALRARRGRRAPMRSVIATERARGFDRRLSRHETPCSRERASAGIEAMARVVSVGRAGVSSGRAAAASVVRSGQEWAACYLACRDFSKGEAMKFVGQCALCALAIALLERPVSAELPPCLVGPGKEIAIKRPGEDVKGYLYLPKVIPQEGASLIVALHGCGGLEWHTCKGKDGETWKQPSRRFGEWIKRFREEGYAVFFPESFGQDECENANREKQVTRAEMARLAARQLAGRSDINPKRIALLGWSHGAQAVLEAGLKKTRGQDGAKFRAMIALYPGCFTFLEKEENEWDKEPGVEIFIGEDDDWTREKPCSELDGLSAIQVTKFPYAYHGFDHPEDRVCLRILNKGDEKNERRVHFGGEASAREKTYELVLKALKRGWSRLPEKDFLWQPLDLDFEQGWGLCQEADEWCGGELFDQEFVAEETFLEMVANAFEAMYTKQLDEEIAKVKAMFELKEQDVWAQFEATYKP